MDRDHLELIHDKDRWILPVASQEVTRCCVDYSAVIFLLSNGLQITIEGPFQYSENEDQPSPLDPADDVAANLAPILQIRRKRVSSGFVYNSGQLEIRLLDGSGISVEPSRQFEAWNISGPGGPNGLRIVSMPGGDVAVWQDRRR